MAPGQHSAAGGATTLGAAVTGAAAARAGWLVEVNHQSSRALGEAVRIMEGDALDAPEAVLKVCAELLTNLVTTLDTSGSNPDLDGLTDSGSGPVAELNRNLALVYDSNAARAVVNGTSGANLMMGGVVLPMLRGAGCVVLCDRDAHASVIGGLVVSGAHVEWLWRDYLAEHDVQAPISASAVEARLVSDPLIQAVFVTSPTYDGFDVDIEGIAEVCHRAGALLFIDGAWGAGYGALSDAGFPRSPIQRGADAAVISIHKKGLAPSQIGVALFRETAWAELFDVAGNLGFATTSPAYFLLMVAECQVSALLNRELTQPWARAVASARAIADRVREAHPGFRVITADDVGATSGDPCHLLIHVGDVGVTGYALLGALDRHGITAEKATRDTLLVLIGPAEQEQVDLHLDALRKAASDVLSGGGGARPVDGLARPSIRRAPVMKIRDAVLSIPASVDLDDAIGRISAGVVAVYPPGSAILVPGEPICTEHIDYLRAVHEQGGRIRGLDMNSSPKIRIVRFVN